MFNNESIEFMESLMQQYDDIEKVAEIVGKQKKKSPEALIKLWNEKHVSCCETTKQKLVDRLDSEKVFLFAERCNCKSAVAYAQSLFPGKDSNVMLALGVYHNTLIEGLKRELQK